MAVQPVPDQVSHVRVCLASTLLLALAIGVRPSAGQEPAVIVLDQIAARQRLQRAPRPEFPPLAQIVGATGVVNVEVTIAPDGRVMQAAPLGGPPMLVSAAVRAVRQWRFQPATGESGEPVTVRTIMSVLFGRLTDQNVLDAIVAHADASLRCAIAVGQERFGDALSDCSIAIEREARLARGISQGPRARINHGMALAGLGQYADALDAISNAERLYPKAGWPGFDRALVHLVHARVLRGQGDLRGAAGRYGDAYNDFDRTRRSPVPDAPLRDESLTMQRRVASEWADVLAQAGQVAEAERVRSRAASLK